MDALVMCGGRGTRLATDVEKPLYPIAGEPMVDRVRRALDGSAIETVHAAVSPNAPRTRAHLLDADCEPVETPGDGYVADLEVALDEARIEPPVLTVAADLPLVDPSVVDEVLDAYGSVRAGDGPPPSMTVCVPAARKEGLGLGVESRLPTDETRSVTDESVTAGNGSVTTEDGSLAPTGVNVVGSGDAKQVIHVQDDPRLAVNVNRVEDARIAERELDARGVDRCG